MDLEAGEISPMRGPRASAGACFGRYRCTAAEFSLENPSFRMSHNSLKIKEWCLRQDSNLH